MRDRLLWLFVINSTLYSLTFTSTVMTVCQRTFWQHCRYYTLSPLIVELFMSAFEMDLKSNGQIPRVWHRYVDDVVAIVRKDDITNVLDTLNSKHQSIKFTYETEINEKLPFLDLVLHRIDGKIDIGVYHKPTTAMRTITCDSHCDIKHKQAAYHSMVYRLCRLPLLTI